MWVAAVGALLLAHASPELEHVRREALVVVAKVDGEAARRGVEARAIAGRLTSTLRDGGIRVADLTHGGEPHGPQVAVSIDAIREEAAGADAEVAFSVRVEVRQLVTLPDRRITSAVIWSRAVLGVAAGDELAATVSEAVAEVSEALAENLGAGHPEPEPERARPRRSAPAGDRLAI